MQQRRVSKEPVPLDPPAPTRVSSPPPLGTGDAWSLVEADVCALPAERVQRPKVDLQRAAELVLSVCDELRGDPALYERFLRQASAGELDAQAIEQLERYARAAWHARRMQLRAGVSDTDARVSPELLAEGEALLRRMLPVATYYLGRDPAVAAVLSAIRPRRGHRRLANDLLDLADLYQKHQSLIAVDTVNYRADDLRDARRVASTIVTALRDFSRDDAALWNDRCARLWTLLSTHYDELFQVGHFLLRRTPEVAWKRFPSLVARLRRGVAPRSVVSTDEPSSPAPPSPATPETTSAQAPSPGKKRRRRTR